MGAWIFGRTEEHQFVWVEMSEDLGESFGREGEDVRHCYGGEQEWDVDNVLLRYEHSMSK